jgi:glycine hydroxymethyltransferase
MMFRDPLKELSEILESLGTIICYDASHVGGLIAGNKFQDPLREGAQIMTMSSHKCLPGPQGGMILSKDEYGEKIKETTFPSLVSNHHNHHVAGKAIALAEFIEYGNAYAEQIIKNSKSLAESLYNRGLDVLGSKLGFTESHQIAVDVSKYGLGGDLEKKLEDSNIIVNRQLLYGDVKKGLNYLNPSGIRIGVQEVTRLGMRESEMDQIAELITKVIIKKENSEKIKNDLIELRKNFQKVHYCFESTRDAYEYIKIR